VYVLVLVRFCNDDIFAADIVNRTMQTTRRRRRRRRTRRTQKQTTQTRTE
jgi:hypothetical protein